MTGNHRRAILALVVGPMLVPACSSASVPPGPIGSEPMPPESVDVSEAPSAEASLVTGFSPGPELDQALVESHEAACQQADAEYVAAGGTTQLGGLMTRVAVWQGNDRPIHFYASRTAYAICVLQSADFGVAIHHEAWTALTTTGYVTVAACTSSFQFDYEICIGTRHPLVAAVEVTNPMATDPAWASVGASLFLVEFEFPGEESTVDSWSYVPYDSCGQVLREVTLQGEPTPCPPSTCARPDSRPSVGLLVVM